jgi:hypothetical protein
MYCVIIQYQLQNIGLMTQGRIFVEMLEEMETGGAAVWPTA